jgi:hypothetical protein
MSAIRFAIIMFVVSGLTWVTDWRVFLAILSMSVIAAIDGWVERLAGKGE